MISNYSKTSLEDILESRNREEMSSKLVAKPHIQRKDYAIDYSLTKINVPLLRGLTKVNTIFRK